MVYFAYACKGTRLLLESFHIKYTVGKIDHKVGNKRNKKNVHWYDHKRIQKKLGYLLPVLYRLKFAN